MKAITALVSLSLLSAVPLYAASDKKVDPDTVKVNEDNEAEAITEDGTKIQMEEDTEYETTDDREIEYDKDPIGDDQVEIDD